MVLLGSTASNTKGDLDPGAPRVKNVAVSLALRCISREVTVGNTLRIEHALYIADCITSREGMSAVSYWVTGGDLPLDTIPRRCFDTMPCNTPSLKTRRVQIHLVRDQLEDLYPQNILFGIY